MKAEELYLKCQSLVEEKNYPEAIKNYKKLIALKEDARYLIAFGVCLQEAKHWEESIEYLKKGIALKPHYAYGDAILFLADSYLETGQIKKAVKQWKIAKDLDPFYPSYEYVPNKAKEMLAKYAQ